HLTGIGTAPASNAACRRPAALHVSEQLVFDLAAPEPPSFGNFLPGGNAEALAAVQGLASGISAETGVMMWGAPGAGKTHMLRAAVAAVDARGPTAMFVADAAELRAHDPAALADPCPVASDRTQRLEP